MMLSRTVRLARTRVVAACCVLIALSGCGPGVVGTGSGTDDDGSEDIQYLPLGLCTAPFEEIGLACSPDISDPDRGTAPVRWADANKSNEGAAALASLEAQGMQLVIPCGQVTYEVDGGSYRTARSPSSAAMSARTHLTGSPPLHASGPRPTNRMPWAGFRSKTRRGPNCSGRGWSARLMAR
ncbi:hypothetical protein X551_02042 [Methylibium sp. T29]|nr:hypothetical protein X551_02042 [Methylibium sp. T29]EWS59609.1 hypothetical protein Y694_02594 [Methylibium sp. T29-B]